MHTDSWRALASHRNALNLIRLLLAGMVLVSHAWPLARNAHDPTWGHLKLGTFAVGGFFAISGFLIMGSRLRLPLLPFLWRRCVRIFPGFGVALVVTATLVAPLATISRGAWHPGDAVRYMWSNLALAYHGRPGISGGPVAPFGPVWNGSLWTLVYEFAAYVALGVLLAVPFVRRYPARAVGALFVAFTAAGPAVQQHVHRPEVGNSIQLGRYFLAGALIFVALDRLKRPAIWAGVSAVSLVVIGAFDQAELLFPLPLAIVLLYLGSTLPTHFGSENDISYGLYIYAFPIEQLLAVFGVHNPWELIAAALPLTSVAAWVSWHVIEKRALRFKTVAAPGPIVVIPPEPAVEG